MAYSWITPKINWASGDFCTHVDVNRILNNILYLYEQIGITPLHPTFTPTLVSSNYLTYIGYNWVQEEVFHLYGLIGGLSDYSYIPNKTINSSPWGSADLNTLESLLLECKDIVDEGDYILNYIYAGAGMYCDNDDLI